MLIRPIDIENQITELCKSFLQNPNSIILAISNSTDDIVNSECLKFAMQIDTKGERTIAILTKFDLFEGSQKYLSQICSKKLINLDLGFIVVSNQEFKKEDYYQQILEKYPILKKNNNYGRNNLLKKLSTILISKIQNQIPQIRQNLHSLLNSLQTQSNSILIKQDLQKLDEKGKGVLMLNYIDKFVNASQKFMNGDYFDVGVEVQGAALINEIIDRNFRKEILGMNILDVVKEKDIYTAVKNSNGFKPSLFVSQKAFETLCKHMINKLMPASLDCAEAVGQEMRNLFNNVQIEELNCFEELIQEIKQIVCELIQTRLEPTKQFIVQFFEIETGHINTKHPDFLDSATEAILQQNEHEEQSEFMKSIPKREKNEINLIKNMLYNYFEVVKKNMCDYIPKIILTLLVQKTLSDCSTVLIEKLYRKEQIMKLMKENDEIVKKKVELNKKIETIKDCLKNLNTFL